MSAGLLCLAGEIQLYNEGGPFGKPLRAAYGCRPGYEETKREGDRICQFTCAEILFVAVSLFLRASRLMVQGPGIDPRTGGIADVDSVWSTSCSEPDRSSYDPGQGLSLIHI